MRLSFDPEPSENPPYPDGYWHAETEDGGFDADGDTPLSAVTKLALLLEEELAACQEEERGLQG